MEEDLNYLNLKEILSKLKYVFDICSIEIKKEQNYTVTVEALKYEKKVMVTF